LWGTDLQFESDIDHPQLKYFLDVARNRTDAGDRIILCTATPSWVNVGHGETDAYRSLAYFERTVIHEHRLSLAATITGDLHHYSRYEGTVRGQHKITAGGGGAYLYPTHQLPPQLPLPTGETPRGVDLDEHRETYDCKQEYPDAQRSRRLAASILSFPFTNWRFGRLLAALYLLYAWLIQSASKWIGGESLVDRLGADGVRSVGQVAGEFGRVLAHAPASVVFTLLIVLGLMAFAKPERKGVGPTWRARGVGAVHGILHIALCFALIGLSATVNARLMPGMSADHPWLVVAFTLEMLGLGWLFGGLLMALYLYLSHRVCGMHGNEIFSARRIVDYKNFLRMHIAPDGRLTIYPIGVEEVCRSWRLASERPPGSTWFEPDDGVEIGRRARLIEKPITFPPAATTAGVPVAPAGQVPSEGSIR
jgi:hypothetical protein